MLRVCLQVCVFVCVEELHVHHLSFPDKSQHLSRENKGHFHIKHISLYTVPVPSHPPDLPLCPLSSGLYYVDSEGNRVCGDLFAVGSGSMYAYGVMDSGLRQDLSVEEACELGRRAIYQATYRDAYSGGQVNLYHVHSEGWTRVSQEDVLMLHQQYKDQA